MSVAYTPKDYPQDAPAYDAVAVVPSDSTALTITPRFLYIGVSGDVKVTMLGGGVVVFKSVPVGVLNVRASLVWSTGTTATNILALW